MLTIEPLVQAQQFAVKPVTLVDWAPACPCRILFNAGTNSGKSTVIHNLWLKVYQPFFQNRVFVFCPNADEVHTWLGMGVSRRQIYTDYKISDLHKLISYQKQHVLKSNQQKKTPKQCLFIFEDITQAPITRARNSRFNVMLTNCRHDGISIWASAQLYHTVERIARTQFDNYVFFRIFNQDELRQIAEDNSVSVKEFNRVYRYATEHRPFGFLYIKRSPRLGVAYYAHFCSQPITEEEIVAWERNGGGGSDTEQLRKT